MPIRLLSALQRLLALVSCALAFVPSLPATPHFSLTDVWTPAGEDLDGDGVPEPHFVYAAAVTWNDTVLVACEGRINHSGDGGPKYLFIKRSTDQGATWGANIQVEGGDGVSWTNPAFVVDGVTTYFFYSGSPAGTKELFFRTSTDNGVTWGARSSITGLWTGNPSGWTQHGTIGHGIKKLKDPDRGRLFLTYHHRTSATTPAGTALYGNDVIYRTAAGNWAIAGGPPIDLTRGTNEARIAERANGTLVMIARNRWNSAAVPRSRVTADASGTSWNNWVDAADITGTSAVDGGFLRFSDTCHLYSYPNNPGSPTRLNMTVRASGDGGVSWGAAKLIYGGPATYSDLARDSSGNIYCVFGRDGDNHNSGASARVTVAKFNLEWVTGTDKPTLVVDNGGSGFTTTGTWSTSSTVAGCYGTDYAYSPSGTATAKWTPTIAVAGNYEAYIRWTADANRPDTAPIEIAYNGGSATATTTINQKTEGGGWYYLGTFNFAAGTGNSVKITASDAGATIADAVMFQKQ